MDQWHHMSDDNKIIKIEYDNNGDGKIDQTDIYEKNKTPVRAEVDRNFDGNTDQVQYYRTDGSLEKIEKDTEFSGKINRKENLVLTAF